MTENEGKTDTYRENWFFQQKKKQTHTNITDVHVLKCAFCAGKYPKCMKNLQNHKNQAKTRRKKTSKRHLLQEHLTQNTSHGHITGLCFGETATSTALDTSGSPHSAHRLQNCTLLLGLSRGIDEHRIVRLSRFDCSAAHQCCSSAALGLLMLRPMPMLLLLLPWGLLIVMRTRPIPVLLLPWGALDRDDDQAHAHAA